MIKIRAFKLEHIPYFLELGLAIEPIFIDGRGECTVVKLENGERIIVACSTSRIVEGLCRYLFLDRKYLIQRVRQELQLVQLVPLPLFSSKILLPFRSPLSTRNKIWVFEHAIKDILLLEKQNISLVNLVDKHMLRLPYSARFVYLQRSRAILIQQYLKKNHK